MGGTTSCRCTKEGDKNEMDLNKERDSFLFQNEEVNERKEEKNKSNFAKSKNSLPGQGNGNSNLVTNKELINNKNNSNLSLSNGNFFQINQDQIHQRKISNTNQSINFNDSSNETPKDDIESFKNMENNLIKNSNSFSSKDLKNMNNYEQRLSNKNLNGEPLKGTSPHYHSTTDLKTNNNVNFTNAAGVINQNISRSNSLNNNPTKKYSNFNTNSMVSGSKLPLEVINEIHDIERDSHGDGRSLNLYRLNSNSEIRENNLQSNNILSNENEVPKNYLSNERITSGEDSESKSNSNIVDKIRDINSNPNQNVKNNKSNLQGSGELKSSFVKKTKNAILNITSIIPEQRLLYSSTGKLF
jgi:hypothetical protein